MINIILIGGNGFIGKSLVNKLLSTHKYNIYVLVKNKKKLDLKNNVFFLDIKDLKKNKYEFDIAINLAWNGTNINERKDWKIQVNNIFNSTNILNLLSKTNLKKYFNLSSIMVDELYNDIFNCEKIDDSKKYALAKYINSFFIKIRCNELNIQFFDLIITNTFGPGESSDRLINKIIKSFINDTNVILSDCNQLYSFIYIDDLVDLILHIVDNGIEGKRYVIGDKNLRTLKEYIILIYETLNRITNLNKKPIFSNKKIVSLTKNQLSTKNTFLKYEKKLKDFSEAIKDTYEWYIKK